jgi:hypothetical protein
MAASRTIDRQRQGALTGLPRDGAVARTVRANCDVPRQCGQIFTWAPSSTTRCDGRQRKPHEPEPSSPVPDEGRERYWAAYRRGVQRGVCGSFGVPDAEHDRWVSMHADQQNDERDGYAEGLRFGQFLVKI